MRHTEFSYENLLANPERVGPYMLRSQPMDGAFFFMGKEGQKDMGQGWKFHISVEQQDVPRAWNLVADYLIDRGLGPAKVVTPGAASRFNDASYGQSGKMITVYDFGQAGNWQPIMQDIENLLAENGVRPGLAVKGDAQIHGSHYMSYRNDRGRDGNYISSAEAKRLAPSERQHNVGQWQNHFAGVRVQNPTQLAAQQAAQRGEKLPHAQYWKPQRDQENNPMMSLPIEGAPAAEVAKVKALLKQHGFSPEERSSKSMGGRVMYVAGEDASRLRSALIREAGAKPPQQPSRGR